MERNIAIEKLKELKGQELHKLAKDFGITVSTPQGKVHKGWAGNVCERFLGLPLNSAQSPNFGSWELKCVPIKFLKDGTLAFKETMAITMLDPYHVERTDFKDSHLLAKLLKMIIVTRLVGNTHMEPSFVHSITSIDLGGEIYTQVEADYNLIRACLLDPTKGVNSLSGKLGKYIQPRTKGSGHGSVSRAFYARKLFLAQFIKLT